MAVMDVNPTRMELNRLKKLLTTAVRGHKLLKDKRDEMMRQFIILIKQNKELREAVEAKLSAAMSDFVLARAIMSGEIMQESVMVPTREIKIEAETRNIMSVDVPVLKAVEVDKQGVSSFPYSFANTTAELDGAILTLGNVLDEMLELAKVEKACQMLADEIEKTRRRVNALEYVMIPQYEETIKSITMKLDENDRSTRTRLMKVKDIINARS